MPHTLAIVAAVLVQAWFLADRWPREIVVLPAGLIIALTIHHDLRHREWGFAPRALLPGLFGALLLTLVLGAVILGAGFALGTLHFPCGKGAASWILMRWFEPGSRKSGMRGTKPRSIG